MSSGAEVQIAVALYARDPISFDKTKRKIYKHETYHWGILIISPGSIYDAYDATDKNEIDPSTFRQNNPEGLWWFQARQDVDLNSTLKPLGYIIIGATSSEGSGEGFKSREDIRKMLAEIPLPQRGRDPQESCVTWVGNAIRKFQCDKHIDEFEVGEFLNWALQYGDTRMWQPENIEEVVYYEMRPEM